jgi:hypothetical protein
MYNPSFESHPIGTYLEKVVRIALGASRSVLQRAMALRQEITLKASI